MPQGVSGKLIEIVPALLHGRSAVGLIVIEIGAGALQFDDGRRRDGLPEDEKAQCPVRNSRTGDGGILLAVVIVRGFRDDLYPSASPKIFWRNSASSYVSFWARCPSIAI